MDKIFVFKHIDVDVTIIVTSTDENSARVLLDKYTSDEKYFRLENAISNG